MNRTYTILVFLSLLLSAFSLNAQEPESGVDETETLGEDVQIDSALIGSNIFSILPSSIELWQPSGTELVMENHIALNSSKLQSGYRIRLFLDSRRGAREASLLALKSFNERYPYILCYRQYVAPNFKVTVGNFRTRIEAEWFLRQIRSEFPEAFVAREKFKFPSLGLPDTRMWVDESIIEKGDD